MSALERLAELGSATIYEARGRRGLVDVDLIQVLPGTAIAGTARTVRCAQDDNRGVHELVAHITPGDVAVLTMPEARPIALIGDLLVTQLRQQGAVGVLVDASVRDVDALRELGLPVWTRWIRAHGATKDTRGEVGVTVTVGGAEIADGDAIIVDVDGATVVPAADVDEAVRLGEAREAKEAASRAQYLAGRISYDLYGFREQDAAADALGAR